MFWRTTSANRGEREKHIDAPIVVEKMLFPTDGRISILWCIFLIALSKLEQTYGKPGPITKEDLYRALLEARVVVENTSARKNENLRQGCVFNKPSSESVHRSFSLEDPENLPEIKSRGSLEIETVNRLVINLNLPLQSRAQEISEVSLEGTGLCPDPPVCGDTYYRTFDGSCNNLKYPTWGKSYTQFKRLLTPVYDDGVNSPRQYVNGGCPLPNPRNVVLKWAGDRDQPFKDITSLLTNYGQFLAHETSSTAAAGDEADLIISCCNPKCRYNPDLKLPDCDPITIPENDNYYLSRDKTCIEFVRSLAAPSDTCTLGPRQQLNMQTSLVDGSVIYGPKKERANELRTFLRGKLRSSLTDDRILPPHYTDECNSIKENLPCFLAGDGRVSENPELSLMHTIWFREHNRIAGILAALNPKWNDEMIFQQTRRIIVAMQQHITYNEFLPIILGPEVMRKYGLTLQKKGFANVYDDSINPATANVFGAAAFRIGHSMVHSFVPYNQLPDYIQLMRFWYSDPSLGYDNASIDNLLKGILAQRSEKVDRFFTKEVTNHLYQTHQEEHGLDLITFNIQRGRDHGLPGYGSWLGYCNEAELQNWIQLPFHVGVAAAYHFLFLYKNPQDIDLFPALISEPQVKGGTVGKLAACLIARKFRDAKFGDRFWYENGNAPTSFTKGQLQEIRKSSMGRLLCDNTNLQSIQKDPFHILDSDVNPEDQCYRGKIPRVDLKLWRAR